MHQPIKLLALDLDGTVLNNAKHITPVTRAALEAAIAAGVTVIPASGRPMTGLCEEFLSIPGVEYALTSNGAAVYRLALCRMQSVQDAEDVYQDVFLRLLGQEASAWDGEHLRAWLLRCTVNRCHDLHRFRLRRPVLALADLPETAAEADSGAAELWDAVARLPEKLRVPIHLYYAEGYSTEEIAGLLDIPAATVRTRLRRARKRLKDLLGGDDHEEERLSEFDGAYPAPRRAE